MVSSVEKVTHAININQVANLQLLNVLLLIKIPKVFMQTLKHHFTFEAVIRIDQLYFLTHINDGVK